MGCRFESRSPDPCTAFDAPAGSLLCGGGKARLGGGVVSVRRLSANATI
jgi:hypothetical protein